MKIVLGNKFAEVIFMEKNNHEMMLKVPQITIVFWIAKLLTTAFGEAFSDYIFFGHFFSEHVTILIGLGVLLILLAIQLTAKKYVPWIYWRCFCWN